MNASFACALSAAHDAAASQHYPKSALYVVATPIGNLADITLRALHILQLADTIACEDTRHTQTLLRAYGIDKHSRQLFAVHEHNEAQASDDVLEMLRAGQRVAYVSDAGTPALSDPGARLVAVCLANAVPVIPAPGASSIVTALSVAGVRLEAGFVFAGFLPTKTGERALEIDRLAQEPRAVVLLEAPHRIAELAQALGTLQQRGVTVARELSKQFEEIAALSARDLVAWLNVHPARSRGEFVLVLHPQAAADDSAEGLRVLKLLLAQLPVKTAVRLTAEITGDSRNDLYSTALALKASAK